MVLSPHLDDAVFSLGAYIHHEARRGVAIRVVTVLANDPSAQTTAGSWDARCGFASAAAAAKARRDEDRRACAIVGAATHWLPYGDETYGRSASDEQIWDAILGSLDGSALVLVPGFPLRHSDHAWLAQLVMQRQAEIPCPAGFYAEQPYASIALAQRHRPVAPGSLAFRRAPTGAHDVYAKVRACLQYRSQLRALGARVLLRAFALERLYRGELVALPRLRDLP